MKKVNSVSGSSFTDFNGLDTFRVMPTGKVPMERMDPFIFMNHHGPQDYVPDNNGLPSGPHPHKGFETVTFIMQGDLVHKDNTGFSSNIKAGGIQWMTAGRGIMHSETSSEEFKKSGGGVEIIQLWLNLPSRLKLSPPAYIGLQRSEIPELVSDNGKVQVQVVSGSFDGTTAPIQSISGVDLAVLHFKASGHLTIPVPRDRRVLFYVVRGSVLANDSLVETNELAEFDLEAGDIDINASEDSIIIFGHATPPNEPIMANGPFVMNTEEEISQAYSDYNSGRFGEWQH